MRIEMFEDYHEIPKGRQKGESMIEIGCFPTKDHPHFMYYCLFYKGPRPGTNTVYCEIKDQLVLNRETDLFEIDVIKEIDDSLFSGPMPIT